MPVDQMYRAYPQNTNRQLHQLPNLAYLPFQNMPQFHRDYFNYCGQQRQQPQMNNWRDSTWRRNQNNSRTTTVQPVPVTQRLNYFENLKQSETKPSNTTSADIKKPILSIRPAELNSSDSESELISLILAKKASDNEPDGNISDEANKEEQKDSTTEKKLELSEAVIAENVMTNSEVAANVMTSFEVAENVMTSSEVAKNVITSTEVAQLTAAVCDMQIEHSETNDSFSDALPELKDVKKFSSHLLLYFTIYIYFYFFF